MLKTSELLPCHGSAASQWKRQHGARPLPNRVRDVQPDDKRVLPRGDRLRDRYRQADRHRDTHRDKHKQRQRQTQTPVTSSDPSQSSSEKKIRRLKRYNLTQNRAAIISTILIIFKHINILQL